MYSGDGDADHGDVMGPHPACICLMFKPDVDQIISFSDFDFPSGMGGHVVGTCGSPCPAPAVARLATCSPTNGQCSTIQ